MAKIYDITSRLQRRTEFKAEVMDAGAFDTARERLFGSRARIAALMVTKTQDELHREYRDDLAPLADRIDLINALSEECQAISAIADAALARLMLVGHEICADA